MRAAIMVQDRQRSLLFAPVCRGVATCPWAPFVQARIAAELGVLSPNVSSPSESRPSDEIRKPDESAAAYSCNASDPVLPSTFVFEDQVRSSARKIDIWREFPDDRPS